MGDDYSLPNTENIDVIRAAIAYEIAKRAMSKQLSATTQPEKYAKQFSEIYIATWKTIIERKEETK